MKSKFCTRVLNNINRLSLTVCLRSRNKVFLDGIFSKIDLKIELFSVILYFFRQFQYSVLKDKLANGPVSSLASQETPVFLSIRFWLRSETFLLGFSATEPDYRTNSDILNFGSNFIILGQLLKITKFSNNVTKRLHLFLKFIFGPVCFSMFSEENKVPDLDLLAI